MGEFINFKIRGIGVRPTNATLNHLDLSPLVYSHSMHVKVYLRENIVETHD